MSSGIIYALADFVDRLIPKRGGGADLEHIRSVLSGLKRLAEVEERNPFVTINATVTAGVWVLYRGRQRLLINPGQKFLRVEAAYRSSPSDLAEIVSYFAPAVAAGYIEKTVREDYNQWRIPGLHLDLVWKFVEQLEGPKAGELSIEQNASHPRYFNGEVRELALAAFEKDGRICPGVAGKTSRHRVAQDMQIEFDHILPFSRGGSSSERNIQVLCFDCNHRKSDSAW